jgi:hypothetical protein
VFEELSTNRRQQISRRDPWLCVARVALLLLLLMIAISPITQSIWKTDNFLHGQDTETTLVLGLTLASIAILWMQRSRVDLDDTLKALRHYVASLFGAWLLWYLRGFAHSFPEPATMLHRRGPPGRQTGYRLPLLI